MIESLELRDWKGIEQRLVTFEDGLNVLVGPNGAGKTSIMEAISLAFGGRTALGDARTMIRHGAAKAEIKVVFDVAGAQYEVLRVVRPRGRGGAELSRVGGERVAVGWEETTAAMEQLVGCSALLFSHVVYLSETRVQSLAAEPPRPGGDTLAREIDYVLGVERMRRISGAARKAQREFKRRADELRSWREGVLASRVPDVDEVRARRSELGEAEKAAEEAAERLKDVAARAQEVSARRTQVEKLVAELRSAAERLGVDKEGGVAIGEVVPRLRAARDEDRTRLEELDRTRMGVVAGTGRAQARAEQISKTLDLLEGPRSAEGPAKCPVCGTELSREQMEAIATRLADERSSAESQMKELLAARGELEAQRDGLVRELAWVEEQLPRLAALAEPLGEEAQLGELEEEAARLGQERDRLGAERVGLEDETRRLRGVARELGRQVAEVEARVEQRGKARLAVRQMSRSAVASFLCEALAVATEDAISQQRSLKLESVLAEVSGVWNSFGAWSGARVELDERGLPKVRTELYDFDFASLSGGERMALLVVLRVLLARRLTNADFVLLDEPFEHLDVVNRRSLLRFLETVCNKRLVRQMVVCTFEERLARAYIPSEGIRNVREGVAA